MNNFNNNKKINNVYNNNENDNKIIYDKEDEINNKNNNIYNNNNNNNNEKKLYCVTCNECVCVDCIGDNHRKHSITNVINKVEEIKEEWKKEVENFINDVINNHLKSIDIQYEKLSKEIDQTIGEIKRLEDNLKNLIDKKERMIADMNMMKESKEKINQTTSFLLSFLQSLPPLPLSSFLPSSSHTNNNNNNIINIKEENKEEKGRKRIKHFFQKENLISLYSSLLPSSIPSLSSLSLNNNINNDQNNCVNMGQSRRRRSRSRSKGRESSRSRSPGCKSRSRSPVRRNLNEYLSIFD